MRPADKSWDGIGIYSIKRLYLQRDETYRTSYKEHCCPVQEVQGEQANYFDFKYSLQDLFGREVDLVEEQTIRNPYFRKSVDSTKQPIFSGA